MAVPPQVPPPGGDEVALPGAGLPLADMPSLRCDCGRGGPELMGGGTRAGVGDKASHQPHAVPAGGRVAPDPEETKPGAANVEASPRPIITVRAFAERSGRPLEEASRLADVFCRVGLWEPYGVLWDGTPTYTFASPVPTIILGRWT